MLFWFFGPFRFIFTILFIVFGIRLVSRLIRRLTGDLDDPFQNREHLDGPFGRRSLAEDVARQRRMELASDPSRLSRREAEIFRLADRNRGRITLSDVVLEIGTGMQESEKLLEKMVDGMHVRMEVDDRGVVIYEFPEIIRKYEGREGE